VLLREKKDPNVFILRVKESSSLLDPEVEGTIILENTENCVSSDTV